MGLKPRTGYSLSMNTHTHALPNVLLALGLAFTRSRGIRERLPREVELSCCVQLRQEIEEPMLP